MEGLLSLEKKTKRVFTTSLDGRRRRTTTDPTSETWSCPLTNNLLTPSFVSLKQFLDLQYPFPCSPENVLSPIERDETTYTNQLWFSHVENKIFYGAAQLQFLKRSIRLTLSYMSFRVTEERGLCVCLPIFPYVRTCRCQIRVPWTLLSSYTQIPLPNKQNVEHNLVPYECHWRHSRISSRWEWKPR